VGTAWYFVGRLSVVSAGLSVTLTVLAPLLFLVAVYPVVRRELGTLQRLEGLPPPHSARLFVLEGFVMVVAFSAVMLVLRRDAFGDGEVRFDPLAAATPSLVALAIGILAFRLAVGPVTVGSWLAARSRG